MAAAALALTGAAASVHGSDGATASPAFTDMAFGRLLFETGRLSDARAFLEQARPADEDEVVERLFLLGRIEMRLGLPRAAARRFEAILVRRPDLTRARLELATAYYAAERDDKARYHFEQSLADRLPSSVEDEVRRFLDRIDNRKRWSSTISLALAPESNPVRRTGRKTVEIGGAPWQLDPDSRSASGTGIHLSGGTSFSPPISGGVTGVLAATGSAKLYRESDWNDVSLAGDIGLASPLDRLTLSGGLRAGRRWLGGNGYSRSLGLWTRGGMRLSARTRAALASDFTRIRHDDHPHRDGWRLAARPNLFHAMSSRSEIEAGLDIEISTARESHLASRMTGASLAFAYAFEGGLTIRPAVGAWMRRYDGSDPLFGKTRKDVTVRPSLTVLHRSLQYEGFAPYVGYTFERASSNIDIHSYRNHAALLGITRKF